MSIKNGRPVPPAVTETHYGIKAVKVAQDQWCWVVDGLAFKWENKPGNNLGIMKEDGSYPYQVWVQNLREAIAFTFGFASGWKTHALQPARVADGKVPVAEGK